MILDDPYSIVVFLIRHLGGMWLGVAPRTEAKNLTCI
jgi:hypothetical protein